MTKTKFLALAILLGTLSLFISHARAGVDAHYGEKVKFAKGAKIAFPDFVLEYTGQHRTSSDKYPHGFLFYDFNATFKGGAIQFSWSSGTGDIGPVALGFHQQRLSIELKRSDKLGPLKDDELVVWKN